MPKSWRDLLTSWVISTFAQPSFLYADCSQTAAGSNRRGKDGRVRAVIFDWGGTLSIWTNPDMEDMWRLAARHIHHIADGQAVSADDHSSHG